MADEQGDLRSLGVRVEGASVSGGADGFRMPLELVDEDAIVAFFRIDGPEDTRGKARAAFASEWSVAFTDVRVSKWWFSPPEPECDECGEPATCGVKATWSGRVPFDGPTFEEKVCAECQTAMLAREGDVFARLSVVKARTLAEVEPYDGWPVVNARRTAPHAFAYWHGERPEDA